MGISIHGSPEKCECVHLIWLCVAWLALAGLSSGAEPRLAHWPPPAPARSCRCEHPVARGSTFHGFLALFCWGLGLGCAWGAAGSTAASRQRAAAGRADMSVPRVREPQPVPRRAPTTPAVRFGWFAEAEKKCSFRVRVFQIPTWQRRNTNLWPGVHRAGSSSTPREGRPKARAKDPETHSTHPESNSTQARVRGSTWRE